MQTPIASAAEGPPAFEVIECGLLGGERILLVEEAEVLEEAERSHPGLVAYGPREIAELERLRDRPDVIRAAHAVKKHLGARVIPQDSPLGRWSRACVAIPAEKFLGAGKEGDGVG